MAGLFLTSAVNSDLVEARIENAREQFAAHGFPDGTSIEFPGWKLIHWPYRMGGPDMVHVAGEDFVAVSGTFVFDGLMGLTALVAFLTAADLPNLDWSRIGGHFACVIRKRGRSFVFTDYFSAFQLFHNQERSFFSSSFLAATKSMPSPRFDPQGVYEFAFNVAPLSDDTVIEGLRTLSPYHIIELTPDGSITHRVEKPLPKTWSNHSLEERLTSHSEGLRLVVGAFTHEFGDRVNCPLSGGIDSRLVLALLRDGGSSPYVYVYGEEGDEDVSIAQAIGAAEGFTVDYIDKGRPAPPPDAFPGLVEHNFNLFDATPTYGNIFDEGGYGEAMRQRHANGWLAASGGCGEIYRDFFFLPDRSASASTVANTFFSGFTSCDTTDRFDARAFTRRVADKIAREAGTASIDAKIDRAHIEHIYPRIRCRAFFGREISVESQFGPYMMPFLDHRVVAEAMTLPMHLKYAGAFESALLNAIDPELASHMSAYGHDFTGEPGFKHRMGEWSTRLRPAWLRANSYAIKRRIGPMADDHGGLLEHEYMRRVIDLDFPVMRKFFKLEGMNDTGLWRRIACLEYLAQRVGVAA